MRRFFYKKTWTILGFLALFSGMVFSPVNTSADSDGNLKLNTDVITNNQIQAGGSGEFPIRGHLFTQELDEQSEKLESERNQLIDDVKNVDFSVKSSDSKNDDKVKKLLFQEYQPQVIIVKDQEDSKQSNWFMMMNIVIIVVLLSVGIVTGKWWTKRKLRKGKS
ncbi:type VII secretion protein EssA [Lactococcus hodotermopsidis]|nr:type VII secretion protein EssA [Lactococcus hodotermopsidis]